LPKKWAAFSGRCSLEQITPTVFLNPFQKMTGDLTKYYQATTRRISYVLGEWAAQEQPRRPPGASHRQRNEQVCYAGGELIETKLIITVRRAEPHHQTWQITVGALFDRFGAATFQPRLAKSLTQSRIPQMSLTPSSELLLKMGRKLKWRSDLKTNRRLFMKEELKSSIPEQLSRANVHSSEAI
jgi:hypothetical protein